ncbi:MAG: DUF5522 domain-containing protein [Mucilaginibacter sp.]
MDTAWRWQLFKKVFRQYYICKTLELRMLQENIDYYINEDGNFVFTREYHLKRGFCCKNKCLHCPWDYGKPKGSKQIKK